MSTGGHHLRDLRIGRDSSKEYRLSKANRRIEEKRRHSSTAGIRAAIRGLRSTRSTQYNHKQFCETTTSKVITAEIQRRRYEMAVVLEFLQIRYVRKQRHLDNQQVQLSEFSARRKRREDRAWSYTHKFKLRCRR